MAGISVEEAARLLRQGGLIAYPTEAVWGFGCDPFNREAVLRLLRLKRRSVGKGLLLVAAELDQIGELLKPLTAAQIASLRESWPGHNTWLIPDPARLYPDWIRGDHASVAIRLSAHPLVREISLAFDGAVVSTSANLGGETEIRGSAEIETRFGGEIDGMVEGELGGRDEPSAIRDLLTGVRIR